MNPVKLYFLQEHQPRRRIERREGGVDQEIAKTAEKEVAPGTAVTGDHEGVAAETEKERIRQRMVNNQQQGEKRVWWVGQ